MDALLKKKLIDYGFFMGLVLIFSAILVPMFYFSQNSKERCFTQAIQTLLDEKFSDSEEKVLVNGALKINSSFSANAYVFALTKKEHYAVILRTETLYGPKPAVFLYNEENVEFLGFALPQGKVTPALSNIENDINVIYWKSKIPSLMRKVEF